MTSVKLPRRKFLHLAAGAAALPALPRIARAQVYPTRPVRWIVGRNIQHTVHYTELAPARFKEFWRS
jgi:hypothetical protein